MAAGDKVNVIKGHIPDQYHCSCDYCTKAIGELRPADGSYYSRLERRQYYDKAAESGKGGHVAKTPLHIARWAVQAFTKEGDWVLDPTIGAGTTAVEALTQKRNIAGMELQFEDVVRANVKKAIQKGNHAELRFGDARFIGDFLGKIKKPFKLVVNNPPYSGDEHMTSINQGHKVSEARQEKYGDSAFVVFKYDKDLPNLAFLKEGSDYWDALSTIYKSSIEHLDKGGHFVIGVKDMMRKKQPFMFHRDICDLIASFSGAHKMKFVGTAFLKHYPTTLFLNTYFKQYGVQPPLYQTIPVFKKPAAKKK